MRKINWLIKYVFAIFLNTKKKLCVRVYPLHYIRKLSLMVKKRHFIHNLDIFLDNMIEIRKRRKFSLDYRVTREIETTAI